MIPDTLYTLISTTALHDAQSTITFQSSRDSFTFADAEAIILDIVENAMLYYGLDSYSLTDQSWIALREEFCTPIIKKLIGEPDPSLDPTDWLDTRYQTPTSM